MEIRSNMPGPLLSRVRREFRLDFFVETGTAAGHTTELAAIYFDVVFTCEIDSNLLAVAQKRLEQYHNIRFYNMSSPEFIRKIKPSVSQPALWWLDAHWCGGKVKPAKECPLLEELVEVKGTHGHSVILIDDADLIIAPPKPPHDPSHWPTLDAVKEVIAEWKEDVNIEIVQGTLTKVICITPKKL